jgi:hypothetical protein
MDRLINPIERSLLDDLINLYNCDLRRETHLACPVDCLVCAKLAIVVAIEQYRVMKDRVLSVVVDV